MVVCVENLTGCTGPEDAERVLEGDGACIDLSPDPAGPRKLWGLVLLLAIRDRASSAHYHPWLADGGLALVVANVRYVLNPPPAEMAPALVAAARSLIEPRSLVARLAARRGTVCGSFTLDVWGNPFEWDVVCWSSGPRCGAELFRIAPPLDNGHAEPPTTADGGA